ncbi:hypothetical protein BJ875DRAFT_522337 [Amylocarpus encephaloides]|uniref:Uncharacterized protein n=1 Tax=Amylocarpus encephaloides TaxID=45428 RepID=A0A9P7YPJ5_9HELO|nr:hypothetical protein BJ875DRAFT_522337 [Amylocarpus encephaloides]
MQARASPRQASLGSMLAGWSWRRRLGAEMGILDLSGGGGGGGLDVEVEVDVEVEEDEGRWTEVLGRWKMEDGGWRLEHGRTQEARHELAWHRTRWAHGPGTCLYTEYGYSRRRKEGANPWWHGDMVPSSTSTSTSTPIIHAKYTVVLLRRTSTPSSPVLFRPLLSPLSSPVLGCPLLSSLCSSPHGPHEFSEEIVSRRMQQTLSSPVLLSSCPCPPVLLPPVLLSPRSLACLACLACLPLIKPSAVATTPILPIIRGIRGIPSVASVASVADSTDRVQNTWPSHAVRQRPPHLEAGSPLKTPPFDMNLRIRLSPASRLPRCSTVDLNPPGQEMPTSRRASQQSSVYRRDGVAITQNTPTMVIWLLLTLSEGMLRMKDERQPPSDQSVAVPALDYYLRTTKDRFKGRPTVANKGDPANQRAEIFSEASQGKSFGYSTSNLQTRGGGDGEPSYLTSDGELALDIDDPLNQVVASLHSTWQDLVWQQRNPARNLLSWNHAYSTEPLA